MRSKHVNKQGERGDASKIKLHSKIAFHYFQLVITSSEFLCDLSLCQQYTLICFHGFADKLLVLLNNLLSSRNSCLFSAE